MAGSFSVRVAGRILERAPLHVPYPESSDGGPKRAPVRRKGLSRLFFRLSPARPLLPSTVRSSRVRSRLDTMRGWLLTHRIRLWW